MGFPAVLHSLINELFSNRRILKVLSEKLKLSGNFDFDHLAHQTPGYVGADLKALAKEAAAHAVNRIFGSLQDPNQSLGEEKTTGEADAVGQETPMDIDEAGSSIQPALPSHATGHVEAHRTAASNSLKMWREPLTEEQLRPLCIEMTDFEFALKKVQPSSKREGFATVPGVTWEDIGALGPIREELKLAVVEPVRCPERFKAFGIENPVGVLLWGPPGCGKTLLAKAVANESHSNFISVKGPELLNKVCGFFQDLVNMLK
jgi:ribosome biogenesis ATPase